MKPSYQTNWSESFAKIVDIVFITGDGKRFEAHAAKVGSEYVFKMCQDALAEPSLAVRPLPIHMKDFSGDVMEVILEYCYHPNDNDMSFHHIADIWKAANLLDLPSVKKKAEQELGVWLTEVLPERMKDSTSYSTTTRDGRVYVADEVVSALIQATSLPREAHIGTTIDDALGCFISFLTDDTIDDACIVRRREVLALVLLDPRMRDIRHTSLAFLLFVGEYCGARFDLEKTPDHFEGELNEDTPRRSLRAFGLALEVKIGVEEHEEEYGRLDITIENIQAEIVVELEFQVSYTFKVPGNDEKKRQKKTMTKTIAYRACCFRPSDQISVCSLDFQNFLDDDDEDDDRPIRLKDVNVSYKLTVYV